MAEETEQDKIAPGAQRRDGEESGAVERILILMQAESCGACMRAMESARTMAAEPERISFGLSVSMPVDEAGAEAIRSMERVRVVSGSDSAVRAMPGLWQGETRVLLAHPAMQFDRRWDRRLMKIHDECNARGTYPAVLTGYLPRPQDPVDAVSPVAVRGFDRRGRLCFERGTALRYASEPIRSAFLHPDFAFAAAEVFRTLAGAEAPDFLTALQNRWELYTLHEPVLRMTWDDPVPPCAVSAEMDGAAHFGERYGVDFTAHTVGPMAREGVFTHDLDFPQRVPVEEKLQERLRAMQGGKKPEPLCVSAWAGLPDDPDMERVMLHLRRLRAIRRLNLLCFAEGAAVRRVTRSCPNVLEFKQRYGLPVRMEMSPADRARYLRLSRPFLLAASREKLFSFSHYVWIDMDYQHSPVYEEAVLDWETVCTERIVLARVDGEPDLDMIVVPEERLLMLCREITGLCEAAFRSNGRLPEDTDVWQTLLAEHPDWFQLIDLPGRHELLGLTMTSVQETWRLGR